MIVRTTETKAHLGLLLIAALLFAWAFSGLAHGAGSTLAALERIPVHTSDRDEPSEDRRKRLAAIAEAIDAVARDRLERASLIELGHRESHFAEDVCDGSRLGDRDRAHGCWQTWTAVALRGGVEAQADLAIAALRKAGNYCAARGYDRLVGAFALYGTGQICDAPFARERAARALTLAGRL
jgi:hypothetical protein